MPFDVDQDCPPIDKVQYNLELHRIALEGPLAQVNDCLCNNMGSIALTLKKIEQNLKRLVKKELAGTGVQLGRIANYLEVIAASLVNEQRMQLMLSMQPPVAGPSLPGEGEDTSQPLPPLISAPQISGPTVSLPPQAPQVSRPPQAPQPLPPSITVPEEEEQVHAPSAVPQTELPEECSPYQAALNLAKDVFPEYYLEAYINGTLEECLNVGRIVDREGTFSIEPFAQAPEAGTQAAETYDPNFFGD